ncbi:MAG: hypothetical protein WCF99_15200 [Chloroflexales bacterium]
MSILGSIICLGAGIAFAGMSILAAWGGMQAIRQEVLHGFVSANPGPTDRIITLLLISVPLAGVTAIGLLSAVRMSLVAFGLGM